MVLLDSMWTDMFSFGVSPAEKIIRTLLVYVGIVIVIRMFGKRLMAQMNSLDLVVVLLLSNVVQNSIIGDDNSVSGGLLGAVVLVVANWGMDKLEHRFPRLRRLIEGRQTVLIRGGQLHKRKLDALGITHHELAVALRQQGADGISEVESAALEPGGQVLIDLKRERQSAAYGELVVELQAMRAHFDRRLDALGAPEVAMPPVAVPVVGDGRGVQGPQHE